MAFYRSVKDNTIQVEAVKYDSSSISVNNIRSLISVEGENNLLTVRSGNVYVQTRKGTDLVSKGSYVVKDSTGDVFISSSRDFTALYQKVLTTVDLSSSAIADGEYIEVKNTTGVVSRRISPDENTIISRRTGGSIEDYEITSNSLLGRRGTSTMTNIAIGSNEVIGRRGTSDLESFEVTENSLLGRRGGSTLSNFSVASNTLVGRRGTNNLEAFEVTENTIVGRRGSSTLANIGVTENTIIGRTTGGTLDALAVGENTIIGRRGTAGVGGFTVDTNTVVGRRGANLENIAVGENAVLARTAGGNLESLTIGENNILGRTPSGGVVSIPVDENYIVGTFSGALGAAPGSDVLSDSLGATTVGTSLLQLTNPSAITFLRVNADNSVSSLSAVDFRAALSVADISGTPSDNQLSVWTSPTQVEGATGLEWDGSDFTVDGNVGIGTTSPYAKLQVKGDGFGVAYNNRTGIYVDSGDVTAGSGNYGMGLNFSKLGNSAYKKAAIVPVQQTADDDTIGLAFFVSADFGFDSDVIEVMRMEYGGNVGIGTTSPDYTLDVNGTGRFTGNLSAEGDLYVTTDAEHPDFSSGWTGTNWQITADGDGEFRNLKVRGGMEVYELIINRLRYQSGGMIMGHGGGKIASTTGAAGSEVITIEDPEGGTNIPFTAGSILIIQDVDIDSTTVVKKIVREVDSITGSDITLTTTAGGPPDVGNIEVGDEIAAIGHTTTAGLQNSMYFTVTDSDNPFMRIQTDVDSWVDFGANARTKVLIGNLEQLASYGFVPASPGYGLYSDNVYLSGKIVASSGSIGNWSIDSTSLFTGTEDHSGYTGASGDLTLYSDGSNASIHAYNFYIDTTGKIYAKAGEIGGFTIDSTEGLYAGTGATRVQMKPGAGFWAGATAIGDAPFSVTNAGVLTAESGTIGGWTLDSDAIYTGTKSTSDGYASDGITLASSGAIHSTNFYIDADGDIGIRTKQLVYGYLSGTSDLLSHTGGADSTGSTSYVEVKTIELGSYIAPDRTLKIRFSLKTSVGSVGEAFGRVYRGRSGVSTAVGTEQFTSSETYVEFTEDITGWEASDRIELYLKHSVGTAGGETAGNGSFKVLGSIMSTVNETDGAVYS